MIGRNGWPDMKSFLQTQHILVSAALASLTVIHCGRAATNDPPPTLDPAFSAGLATLKQAAGFIEDPRPSTDWKPDLQLLVGVKAVEGSKRIIYFVQLTTLRPPLTNSGPWQPTLRTNDWAWSSSNKAQFVTSLYPVRVRVFDETGRRLKEGQTPMAWGMLTNGLLDLCRLGFEAYHHSNQTNSPITRADPPVRKGERRGEGKESDATKLRNYDEFARATGGGFLWMIGMLYDLQTVPAVADVWAKAQCAIRRPSAWTIAASVVKGLTLSLDIEPRLKEVTLANTATVGDAEPRYRLPVDLNSGKRNLTRVEIIVGPAHGAEMLLAGIRSIRAAHPTKPKQEFLAQVLAAGTGEEQ